MSEASLNRELGRRLRAVRRAKGLSLADVEALTGGEFKSSVVGAYERGERGVSVARLIRLAASYGVDPRELLPRSDADVVVDLTKIEDLSDEQYGIVESFLAAVRGMRGRPAHSGAVRSSDLAVLAAFLGVGRVEVDGG